MVQMIRHVIIRHVNMGIIGVILMIVQEIWRKNKKMMKMKITLTLNLKKDIIESKLQEEFRNRILSEFFIQSNQSGYV